jgi:hypothetical protein
MARYNRRDDISEYHLSRIDRQMALLRIALDDAQLSLTPFKPHYDAITGFKDRMREATNLLMDRPIDYQRPHAAPMSGGRLPPEPLKKAVDAHGGQVNRQDNQG